MKTMKKAGLLLMMVTLVSLCLPASVVLAQGTTVEVNNGNTITLEVNESQIDIPLDISNIVVTPGAQGLAAFHFTLNWDATVIHVNSLTTTVDTITRGFGLTFGSIDNVAGTVIFVGTTTQLPYSSDDLTLVTLSITAVGGTGATTSIKVTIIDLVDNALQQITPRAPIGASVTILGTNLVSIVLSPVNPSITQGSTSQFTAIGSYDDSTTADITDAVSWTSSNQQTATIQGINEGNPGLVTGLAAGTTTITAAMGGISGTGELTVTEPEEGAEPPPTTDPPETTPPEPDPDTGTIPELPPDPEDRETAEPTDDRDTGSDTGPAPESDPDAAPAPGREPASDGIPWWGWVLISVGAVAFISIMAWMMFARHE